MSSIGQFKLLGDVVNALPQLYGRID